MSNFPKFPFFRAILRSASRTPYYDKINRLTNAVLCVKIIYAKQFCTDTLFFGDVKASTGILRHGKRSKLSNLVNCSILKNKRQQNCCYGCLSKARSIGRILL